MSYEEKGTWLFLATAVGGYGVYLILVLPQLAAGASLDEVDWVVPMLWTIGGAIVVAIIGRILIEVITPSETTKPDVRDQEIDRLGERVGGSFIVIGGVGALALAMLDVDTFWIGNVLYLAFAVSGIVSAVTKLVAYRRGVPTW